MPVSFKDNSVLMFDFDADIDDELDLPEHPWDDDLKANESEYICSTSFTSLGNVDESRIDPASLEPPFQAVTSGSDNRSSTLTLSINANMKEGVCPSLSASD